MKKISIVIPTYNEEENVRLMFDAVVSLFKNQLHDYDYELSLIHI